MITTINHHNVIVPAPPRAGAQVSAPAPVIRLRLRPRSETDGDGACHSGQTPGQAARHLVIIQ